jgi:RimJ/RimL family protein N-acetyltransferase
MIATGKTILLRKMERADVPDKVKWYNDSEVNKTLILTEKLELEKTLAWFDKLADNDKRQDFIIESLETGEAIGIMGLVDIDRTHGTAECYGVVGEKKYWGKGIGTESHSLLLRLVFDTMGLHKVWAIVRTENIAILKVIEKLGFKVEGTLREEKFVDGKWIDVYRVAVLKQEFKPIGI